MSTYGPVQLPAYFSSNADFQAWVQGIHNALVAIGLVQTADTGQINPATVAAPSGTSQSMGYEVWRLNDALQATAPFFFKIEYGSSSSSFPTPGMWITVGASTNGAGTLGAPVTPRNAVTPIAGKTAGNTLPLYASGDGSRLALCVNADATNNGFPIWLVCERTRDASGNYTADGLVVCAGASVTATVYLFAVVPSLGSGLAVGWRSQALPLLPASGSGSGSEHRDSAGLNAALGTMVYFLGAPFYGLSLVDVAKADVGGMWGGTFQAAVLGAVHTYLTLLASIPNHDSSADGGNDYLCLLWE